MRSNRTISPLVTGILSGFSALLLGSGCAKPPESKIADLDPYVGGRPPPVRKLAPAPRPAAPRGLSVDADWTPRGGFSRRWECVVVHHSGSDKSTPEGMRSWHMQGRGWDELGYHFVIGNGIGYGDGTVYVGNRWRQQKHGAHCKTPNNYYNDHGVGICLIGDLDRRAPTQKQIASLARLCAFLTTKCGIPKSKIMTHGGVTKKTACPGKNFSLAPVLRQMSQFALFEPDAADPASFDTATAHHDDELP